MKNTSRTSFVSSALVLGSLLAATAMAATKLEAPVKMLTKGHNRVAVLEAAEKLPGNKVAFVTREALHGQSDDRTIVRMDEATWADVEEGETYVAAISNVRRNDRFRELREYDPEGFRIVTILAGGPALLDNRPAIRRLFAERSSLKPEARLESLMAAFESRDRRTLSFAFLELQLRPEVYGLISEKESESLRRLLREPALDAELRAGLLEAVRRINAARTLPWIGAESRKILSAVDPQFDLASFYPILAQTALELVEAHGVPKDAEVAARFLASNNPGVVKAALAALDRLDAKLALARARQTLERGDLHPESRRALEEYVG